MKNELAFNSASDALTVASALIDNGYVVMLSTEENLTILNFLDGKYSTYLDRMIADRNAVVFMSREEFEDLTSHSSLEGEG